MKKPYSLMTEDEKFWANFWAWFWIIVPGAIAGLWLSQYVSKDWALNVLARGGVWPS